MRVRGQGRAYAAVIGVAVGMLVAGLAVPMAFGRLPSDNASTSSSLQTDPGAVLPGAGQSGTGTKSVIILVRPPVVRRGRRTACTTDGLGSQELFKKSCPRDRPLGPAARVVAGT